MASRIFIFSIVLGAEYSSYVKFIATRVPTFFGYIISVIASVGNHLPYVFIEFLLHVYLDSA